MKKFTMMLFVAFLSTIAWAGVPQKGDALLPVEKGAKVTDSIIMPGAKIKAGAVVQYAIVAEDSVIESGAVVGQRPENVQDKDKWGIAVIGNGVTVGAGAIVPAKAMIEADVPAEK